MKNADAFQDMEIELIERHGPDSKAKTLASLGLTLLKKEYPLTCSLVSDRTPFEGLFNFAFYGEAGWKGYLFVDFLIEAWDRDPDAEFVTADPEPGDLFYIPYSAYGPRMHRNPKQKQIRFCLCLHKKNAKEPIMLRGSRFALVKYHNDLIIFKETAMKVMDIRPLNKPPVLMRLTSKGFSQSLGIWKA